MTTRQLLIGHTIFFRSFAHVRSWKLNGLFHSFADIPTIRWSKNCYEWARHGQLHREGGKPAIIWPDDSCADGVNVEYYLHGVKVSAADSTAYRDDDL